VLDQEVTGSLILCNVLAGLSVVSSLLVAIGAGWAVSKWYVTEKLRFLFTLPVGNLKILLSKIIAWCVVLSLYTVSCAVVASVIAGTAAGSVFGYSWMPTDSGIELGVLSSELVAILLDVLFVCISIAVFCAALGTVLKNTYAVLSLSVLLLVTGFISVPGFRATLLPMAQVVTTAVEQMMMLGNGIVPLSVGLTSTNMIASAVIGALSLLVGAIAFSRKVW